MVIDYPPSIDGGRLDYPTVKKLPEHVAIGVPAIYYDDDTGDIIRYAIASPYLTATDKARLDWVILDAPITDPIFTDPDDSAEAMDAHRARIDTFLP